MVGVLGSLSLVTFSLFGSAVPVVDTTSSIYASVQPVGLAEVRWTHGFWADRFETARQHMLPELWSIMDGTNYSQFYQNFRIAAGLAEGKRRGASFNDGDFYKWLEGACAVLESTHDPEWSRRIDEIATTIAKAQRSDGYIHTPILIKQRQGVTNAQPFHDRLQFEMYNMGHLFTAACIHYRVTGHTNLLEVACRAADFLDETFRQPTPELAENSICPSHYMGLIELYRTTRQPRYLALAKRLFAMRSLVQDGTDDNQDRIPFEQQTNAMGHAVRANYLYAGAADLFAETGEPSLWRPLQLIWTNVVQQKMYITGGCGALYDGASPDAAKDQKSITRVHQAYGRNYQLPNTTAHNETCANIGNVLWNWRMFLVTGESRFIDVLELALYNSVLSGGSLDGTNFCYVNPLRSTEPLPTSLRWPQHRTPFISTFCCPPNLFRTIAEVAGYAYSKSNDVLWINLYGANNLSTTLSSGQALKLSEQTEYPWNGIVRLRIDECSIDPFALKLRIPGWSHSVTVRVNGALVDSSAVPGSYFEIRRTWHPGDRVELAIAMPVRLMEANPLVEDDVNQLAVQRGPLIYCLESPDLARRFNLLDVQLPDDLDLISRYDERILGGVVLLEGPALVRASQDFTGPLYRELVPAAPRPIHLRLIPYFAWGNRGVSQMSVWLPRAN